MNVEQLIEDLRNEDWHIRSAAAERLKEVGDARAVEPLIEALDDENYTVRFVAAMTLGIIRDPRAIQPLVEALRKNDDYDLLWATAWALHEIGALSAEPLIEVLDVNDPLTRDMAADVLGRLGDPRAIQPLAVVFREHGLQDRAQTARFGAADALEMFGEDALPIFQEALEDPYPEIRARAVMALGNIGSTRSVPSLIAALADEAYPFAADQSEYRVGDLAAAALEQIGSPEALAAVEGWYAAQQEEENDG